MSIFLEPFQFDFFRYGALAAVMTGALCGAIGVYIVLRGMSYIGHGLSHAIFGGAVVSYVIAWNFYIGAGLWGFLAALLINQTVRRTRVSADAAIGVVTTASFAIGVALISRYRHFTQNFDAALFGNILGVSQGDVAVVAGVTVLVGLFLFFQYRQLLFTTFDTQVAAVYGVRTQWVDTLFSLALAAALIASMQILGVTLIAAALVIPAITSRLLTDSFPRMLLSSILIGALTALTGLYLSYFLDVASGATIVLVQATLFIGALIYSSLRRRMGQRLNNVHV